MHNIHICTNSSASPHDISALLRCSGGCGGEAQGHCRAVTMCLNYIRHSSGGSCRIDKSDMTCDTFETETIPARRTTSSTRQCNNDDNASDVSQHSMHAHSRSPPHTRSRTHWQQVIKTLYCYVGRIGRLPTVVSEVHAAPRSL